MFLPFDRACDGTYGRVWSYSGYGQLQQGDRKDEAVVLFLNVLVVLFESVTGVAGGVDRRERINSTDDVLVALLAFCTLYLNKHISNRKIFTNIRIILVK